MLIAQLTDLHVGYHGDASDEPNLVRLNAAIDWLKAQGRAPDLLLLTGDLTEHGDVASYERLRDAIAGLSFPVHLCVGNHDDRAALLRVFPETGSADGFIQYVVDRPEARIIVLDTLEPGHHGGAFCDIRADWLRARLAEASDKPVLIVLHHPPIDTGIAWLTTHPLEPWVAMLDAAIGDRADITMICGHIHRSITTRWRGRGLSIAPSTAPQVALNLSAIDAEKPDGRAMIVAEAPGVALHLWTGESFVTHHAAAAQAPVIASFDAGIQPFVRQVQAEHAAISA